ncbi:MAG TPA: phasin family protein [Myxococcota bacterium]|nr:phasin family protein [Myxococcota bacterium]
MPRRTPAFERATARVLEGANRLLQDGAELGGQGRDLAVAAAREAREAIAERACALGSGAASAATGLARAFEARVARAVSVLGVASVAEVRALSRQMAELQRSIDQLRRGRARA